ncbi:hypothetical protein DPEC_G00035910 [Dallia pectoralis]|uniref:Uncharacterized protein n=1 Tax=Dallia pectoralis TaxID=75939 RepID=A0ACC2HEC6_DALPE|nr:hypothetical protein DPEC_G00035910 [Dallia pectoralis]
MNLSLILSIVATVLFSTETALGWRLRSGKRSQPAEGTRKVNPARECIVGDGTSYKGFNMFSERARKCLPWKDFPPVGNSLELGDNKYCRNPDKSLRPWCRVKRGERIVREFCDIPKCVPVITPTDTELTCGEKEEPRHKVVGGAVVPVEAQPWMVAIFLRDHFLCGGTLIAPCWVLTAAHCLIDEDGMRAPRRRLTVYLGRSNIVRNDPTREQKFSVEESIIHQDYNNTEGNYNNDIGLLKLRQKDGVCATRSPSVRTACLPPPHIMMPPGAICTAAGYGKTSFGAWEYSNDLRQVTVALLAQSVCQTREYYGKSLTKNMFCAGSPDWKNDSCQGDSGGPLVCEAGGRAFVFGVVSWGEGCARVKKPGIYTRVTNYNTWISEKTGLSVYTAGVMYPQK